MSTRLVGVIASGMGGVTGVPPDMECAEKERLLAKYKASASDFDRVAALLTERAN